MPNLQRQMRVLRMSLWFGRRAWRATLRPVVGDDVDGVLAELHDEVERQLAHLEHPGHVALSMFSLGSAPYIALFVVLRRRQLSADVVGPLAVQHVQKLLRPLPRWLLRLAGRVVFSSWFTSFYGRHAADSQQNAWGGWQWKVDDVDDHRRQWSMRYTSCPLQARLHDEGLGDMAPYLCQLDGVLGDAMGWGLQRTQTLALGANSCDFRFRRGAETSIEPLVPLAPSTSTSSSSSERS